MSGAMVRAILDGTKTQTRRVVSPQPPKECEIAMLDSWDSHDDCCDPEGLKFTPRLNTLGLWDWWPEKPIYCRYGRRGDKLWVKETHSRHCDRHADGTIEYRAGGARFMMCENSGEGDPIGLGTEAEPNPIRPAKWTPSIFMPRWASRITLPITDIRVERLNVINEEDAKAEGLAVVTHGSYIGWKNYRFKTAHPKVGVKPVDEEHRYIGYESPVESYCSLWESINGVGSWATNPWVWVINFKSDLTTKISGNERL